MTQEFKSPIFDSTWSKTMTRTCCSNSNMTICDVGPKVWEPAFRHCQNLLQHLHNRSMTLSNVDKHFGQYSGNLIKLERELKCTFDGVIACAAWEKGTDSRWIHEAVTQIQDYWILCQHEYCDAANSFLELRKCLQLTKGDFGDLERISKNVNKHTLDYL